MSNSSFEVGCSFRLDGRPYRVRDASKRNCVLEDLKDGELESKSRADLGRAYANGTLVFEDLLRPLADTEYSMPKEFQSIADVSDRARRDARVKSHFLHEICPQGHVLYKRTELRDKLLKLNNELPDGLRLARPPSVSCFYSWRQKWIQSGYCVRSLCSRFDLRGRHPVPTPAALLEFIEPTIQEVFLTLNRVTVSETLDQVNGRIEQHNRNQPLADQLPRVTRRMLTREISRAERALILERRYGKPAAENKTRVYGKNKKVRRLLERVEIDHTPLDVLALTSKGGLAARPYLTTIIDVASRMILGLYISFRTPNTGSVLRALRNAILPKDQLLKELRIKTDYEVYGVPMGIFLDNGSEFHGDDLAHVALDLDISLYYCPRRSPRFKGVVERWLKEINYNFMHLLPGTTFDRYFKRGELDSIKDAVIPLEDLNRFVWKWVVEVYSRKEHRGLLTCPREKWSELMVNGSPALPRNASVVEFYTSPVAQRKLSSKGIEINCQFYKSDDLERVRSIHGDIELTVRPDLDNLGSIAVLDPDSKRYFKGYSTDPEYAEGLSLEEDEAIRKLAAEKYSSLPHRGALLLAKVEIWQEVQALKSACTKPAKPSRSSGKHPGKSRPTRGQLHAMAQEASRQQSAATNAPEDSAVMPAPSPRRKVDFSKLQSHPNGQQPLL